jgi:hypothetical protein
MSIESHFFIEQGAFLSNTALQSFGPQSSNEFNLTTSFSLSGEKKAYSICKGVVLIQPQTGSTTKVNLILRPFTQPYKGLNVKYFIYRGLKRSDFFTGDLVKTRDTGTPSSTSDFINKINIDYDDFYKPLTPPPFPSKFIGYDDSEDAPDDSTLLSKFFFKESQFVEAGGVFEEEENTAFELPMIDKGKWLGNFADGECGIDVVLNYGDYEHEFDSGEFVFNLSYARAVKAKITLSGGESTVEKKIKREQITQFIDIAAFYGLFIPEGKVNVHNPQGEVSAKNGTAIYSDLLNSFYTKNRWYITIQSDRGRSYNYYGNYKIADNNAHHLRLGMTESTMADTYYKTQEWPLLIHDATQQTTTGMNSLFFQFVTDNNVNSMVYAQTGTIKNAQKNNFCNADFLRQLPDSEGNFPRLTNTLELVTPATNDGKTMAGLSMLLYQGLIYSYLAGTALNENDEPIDVYATPNFFDDVFHLIHTKPLLQLSADTDFSKMTSERLNLVNHYYDRKQQGISAVQALTVNDVIETGEEETALVKRVTYITENINILANAVSPTGSTTTDTKTSMSAGGAVTKSKTYTLPEPYYYSLKFFTDSTQTITGLELKTTDGSQPTKIILGLTKTENDLLREIITINLSLKNPRLFLIDLFDDGNELISPENIKYQKYKVAIVAENSDGSLQLYQPTTDIMVYSLDRNYHFSKGYSEYVKELITSDKYLIVNKDIE